MEMNRLSLTILLLLAWLSGVLFKAWSSGLIITRVMGLVWTGFLFTVITILLRHSNDAVLTTFTHAQTHGVMEKQLADLQEAHRKRVAFLKNEFAKQSRSFQRTIARSHDDYQRLDTEYDFLANTYQDSQRTIQELEDRIEYLERLRSRNTPTERAPFSAPSSRIQFSDPPRRSPGGSQGPALPSPLSQVDGADPGWV
jgi:murein DD-endopeptidase MepM/ murein hydrolase activator NlpD